MTARKASARTCAAFCTRSLGFSSPAPPPLARSPLSSTTMRHENMAAWTPDEDRIILEMFETSGRKWGKIAAELSSRPNGGIRTSASVRNRYLRIEKGQQLRAEGVGHAEGDAVHVGVRD